MSCSTGQPESYFHTLNVSEVTERVRKTIRIDEDWTQSRFGTISVFVLTPANEKGPYEGKTVYLLERRAVQVQLPGFQYDVYEVKSGLEPGEQIVVSSNSGLVHGMRVVIEQGGS